MCGRINKNGSTIVINGMVDVTHNRTNRIKPFKWNGFRRIEGLDQSDINHIHSINGIEGFTENGMEFKKIGRIGVYVKNDKCFIITQPASPRVKPFHDREPVYLS